MGNTMLFQALREFTTGLLNQLLVNLAGQEGQLWLEEFKRFLRREPCWVSVVETAKRAKVYFSRLYANELLFIGATDNIETFASSGVFPGGVYGATLLTGASKLSPVIGVAVHEMVKSGTFAELFGSLGKNRLRWSEARVVAFCRKYPGKIQRGGYATFFEVEGGFMANVYFDSNGDLGVFIYPFLNGHVLHTGDRLRFVFLAP